MLESLTVERGPLNGLHIPELKNINIFTGANGVGKSLLIEQLRIATEAKVKPDNAELRRDLRNKATKLIPLNTDGAFYLCSILSRGFNSGCIDNFDNNLHPSIFKSLWELLFEITYKLDRQLFIVSYNPSTTISATEVALQQPYHQRGLIFYRLEKQKAFSYNLDELYIAQKHNMFIY